MAAALVVALLLLAAGLWHGAPLPIGDRLARAGIGATVIALWLAAAIGNVARLRFLSSRDIDGASGADASGPVRRAAAICQNTLEQAVLAIAAQVALALAWERAGLAILLLTASFCLGRLLFWHGYAHGAAARALGFALTFYPSVVSLLLALAGFVAHAI